MFETLSKFLATGKDLNLIPGLIFLTLIFKLKEIIDFWDGISHRKLKMLISLINENGIEDSSKTLLKEEIGSICFKYTTGIKAEKYLREEIIKTHDQSNGRISYKDFKNSRSFLTINEDGSLGLRKIEFIEKIYYFFSLVAGYFLLGFSILTFLLIFVSLNEIKNLHIFLSLTLLGLLFFVYSLFCFSQIFPIKSAKKIRREIHFSKTNPYHSLAVDSKGKLPNLPSEAKLEKAWEKWLSEVEQLEVESPNIRQNDYEKILVDKYTKQGLI